MLLFEMELQLDIENGIVGGISRIEFIKVHRHSKAEIPF